AGVDLPCREWFVWHKSRNMRKVVDAVEQSGGFIAETGIMADYWEAAYRDLARRADELEKCVVQATQFLETPKPDDHDDPGRPVGMLVGAYDELEPRVDDRDEPDDSGAEWTALGDW